MIMLILRLAIPLRLLPEGIAGARKGGLMPNHLIKQAMELINYIVGAYKVQRGLYAGFGDGWQGFSPQFVTESSGP